MIDSATTHEVALQPSAVDQLASAGGISLGESVRIAIDTLLANKLRSFLTALGVIIGVAAVVALLAIGRGSQEQIAARIAQNGVNLLTVNSGSLRAGGFSSSGANTQSLTMDDVAALRDPVNAPDATLVAPQYQGAGSLVYESQHTVAMVIGVTPEYLAIRNETVAQGTFITEADIDRKANVAVLGANTAATLFGTANPIGQSIRINGQRFRVVGVLQLKGGSPFGSLDNSVAVPLTTAQYRLFGGRDSVTGKPSVTSILVQARDAQHIDTALAQIQLTLRERHGLPMAGEADDFSIDNQQDLIDTLTETQRTMTLYLGAIAAISLIVGGIGIMNIMIVSVRERTREIGLRKAIGARERDILNQFLIEALTLSTGGGLVGLLAGVLIAVGASATGRAPAVVTPESAALALGVALAIGLFFGIEPARRAARLDPIEALRYE